MSHEIQSETASQVGHQSHLHEVQSVPNFPRPVGFPNSGTPAGGTFLREDLFDPKKSLYSRYLFAQSRLFDLFLSLSCSIHLPNSLTFISGVLWQLRMWNISLLLRPRKIAPALIAKSQGNEMRKHQSMRRAGSRRVRAWAWKRVLVHFLKLFGLPPKS